MGRVFAFFCCEFAKKNYRRPGWMNVRPKYFFNLSLSRSHRPLVAHLVVEQPVSMRTSPQLEFFICSSDTTQCSRVLRSCKCLIVLHRHWFWCIDKHFMSLQIYYSTPVIPHRTGAKILKDRWSCQCQCCFKWPEISKYSDDSWAPICV